MKYLLYLVLLSSVSVFAQDTTADIKTLKKAQKEAVYNRDIEYEPHSIGISYRLGGIGIFQQDVVEQSPRQRRFMVGYQNINFEFYTRTRRGKTQYTPLVELRFGIPFNNNNPGVLFINNTWGFLFGGSQYVFDYRSKEHGMGWSMLANGGFTIEFPTVSSFNSIHDLKYTGIIGGELEFKAIYNVHKYLGVSFGFVLGYTFAPVINTDPNATSPFFLEHGLTWGFNVGLMF
ncbi:MAG: hypothetical protein ACRC0X_04965 [Brevinema sp.]